MTEVDPRFRQMGRGARQRRRRQGMLRALLVLPVIALAGGWLWSRMDVPPLTGGADLDEQLTQVGSEFDIAPVVRGDTFTDIPGDPLIIPSPEQGEARKGKDLPAPPALAAARHASPPPAMVTVMRDDLVPRDRRLVAALPSTREEFALFQAERGRDTVVNASLAAPVADGQVQMSGVALLRGAELRPALWRDMILETTRTSSIAELLQQNGIDGLQAESLSRRIAQQLALEDDQIAAGSVLALRYRMQSGQHQVMQISLYAPQGFVGSLAMSASGQLVPGADAWAGQPILSDLMARSETRGPAVQQRLLDVIYSAALRHDIPSEVIGNALAMMSKIHDLDGFADERDSLTMILALDPAGKVPEILYIGVSGPSGDKPCYVVPAKTEGFECFAPGARVQVRAGGTELQPPVAGVLTQRFIPPEQDSHPDAAKAMAGRGTVVWSAPQDSPVQLVAAGRVTAVSGKSEFGTLVEVAHPNGMISRYAGLGQLDPDVKLNAELSQGTALGKVGVPIGLDRPGLVFQLLEKGQPIDPMPYLSGPGEVLASDAIETLIGRIIHVESGGVAHARNPLSTATGLGQFIESTWMRMMRSYRPDLVASLSPRDVLDLRLNPDLSRQMVRHLAQENEAYLRARGHDISAGRLYLAHFLGPAGADTVLRADPAASVGEVMGGAVVSANPFLRGYSVQNLRDWADRKMTGARSAAGGGGAVVEVVPVSAEVRAFMEAIDSLQKQAQG